MSNGINQPPAPPDLSWTAVIKVSAKNVAAKVRCMGSPSVELLVGLAVRDSKHGQSIIIYCKKRGLKQGDRLPFRLPACVHK